MEPGYESRFSFAGTTTLNDELVDDTVTFEPGRQLEFETIITTATPETTDSDNVDTDKVPVRLPGLSSIE